MSDLVLKDSGDMSAYIGEISKFPILSEQEEVFYAKEKDSGNIDAAKMLVSSYLRLVVKIAVQYKNYGLPMMDIISEGNVGLMRAVKTFDWTKGYKLATYSTWWIKAYIQEYILKMWSIVKIGTSSIQKKLFFNLRKVKRDILSYTKNKYLSSNDVNKMSKLFNVPIADVVEMDNRLNGRDVSLNVKISDDDDGERIDLISSKSSIQDIVDNKRNKEKRKILLQKALENLNEREKEVIRLRRLEDEPLTLAEVSKICGVSGERIRQIEARAIEKMKKVVLLDG
ncbi:MAG: RNA polymerase factor sigma-32 [Rickettsiales bacterium]|jgi:RNA polymerase sigma-32 factor|nr:RNA polymerase factor sigma-32 [Rickettsiales bacterium]